MSEQEVAERQQKMIETMKVVEKAILNNDPIVIATPNSQVIKGNGVELCALTCSLVMELPQMHQLMVLAMLAKQIHER